MNRGIEVTLAVEDQPGEIILRNLVARNPRIFVGRVLPKQGKGHLRNQIEVWNRAAEAIPIIVLADLDTGCAKRMTENWLPGGAHRNLILRIAVHEIEAWIIADHQRFCDHFRIPPAKLPARIEEVSDPKLMLVNLVRQHSPVRLARQIVPEQGDRRQTAPGYNDALAEFLNRSWQAAAAAGNAPSLERAMRRIAEFDPAPPRWGDSIER